MKKLLKAAAFTDIHFGAKSNSELHNADCLQFIDWFCENVKNDPSIDHIMFLGDWHENRSSINLSTLNASFQGAKKLNDLGLPVFFIIGNHDLYTRSTRDIHSVPHFNELENFTLIDKPTVIDQTYKPSFITPFLFHSEYDTIAPNYLDIPIWWGHFEFKDFVITGYNIKMMEGPDATIFKNVQRIFSGHFHKRQSLGNVTYIGNTFPTTFGDVNDFDRGMAIYDYTIDELSFLNWDDCPKYLKINLSNLIDNNCQLYSNARVKCLIDIDISFEEIKVLKNAFTSDYNLREFVFEEMQTEIMEQVETNVDIENISNINELILQLLAEIDVKNINNSTLLSIYKELKL